MKEINVKYPGTVNGVLWNKETIEKQLEPLREFQLKYQVPILMVNSVQFVGLQKTQR